MKYWFKNEDWGDNWQKFKGNAWDHDEVSKAVAEEHYNEDPCDPYKFDFECYVKNEHGEVKRIVVTAEAIVNFYSREISFYEPEYEACHD